MANSLKLWQIAKGIVSGFSLPAWGTLFVCLWHYIDWGGGPPQTPLGRPSASEIHFQTLDVIWLFVSTKYGRIWSLFSGWRTGRPINRNLTTGCFSAGYVPKTGTTPAKTGYFDSFVPIFGTIPALQPIPISLTLKGKDSSLNLSWTGRISGAN